MKLAFIENREHLHVLVQHCEVPTETECWLYDPQLLAEIQGFGFQARVLGERDLKDECNGISAWAREKALNWFYDAFLARNYNFYGVNLLDACSHFTSYALSWLVDCYLLIDAHLSQDVSSVYLFDRSGEICVNSIFALVARSRGIKTKTIPLAGMSLPKPSFKELFRDGLGKAYAVFDQSRSCKQGAFIFCGGLRHLAPLIHHQKGRFPFMLLEDLFQGEQFSYCLKNKVRYSLLGEWITTEEEVEIRAFFEKIIHSRPAVLKNIEEKGLLSYKGKKMLGIEDLLFDKISGHFFRCLRDILIARKIAEKVRPRGVVLDDDTNTKRAFVLSLKACNVPIFITAHGEMGLTYSVRPESAKVSIGQMFVNSPYSKMKHSSAGWDENKLIVTGLPQYDQIAKLRAARPKVPIKGRKKVLYCPHYMSLNAIKSQRPFEDGLRAGDKGTRLNNEAVLQAFEAVDCDLWIKFYRDEAAAWKKFLRTRKVNTNVRFFHHSENIFRLLNDCDALISCDVSTVILEGMMFDKPVLSLNFSGFDDVHPYPKEGMVFGVYRPEDLAPALKTCLYDEVYLHELQQRRDRRMDFYWSGSDGQSTERVWQQILEAAN